MIDGYPASLILGIAVPLALTVLYLIVRALDKEE